MSNTTTDLPAFPTLGPLAATGLTKRELFAAMAMQGLLANYTACCEAGFQDQRGDFESFAIARADALLAELAKPREGT